MQKLIKLTGVSILAIVASVNANAAGYTCEELIEYTSCNDGYYLSDKKCIENITCPAGNYLATSCPEGLTYHKGWCLLACGADCYRFGLDYPTQEDCTDMGETWYGAGCANESEEYDSLNEVSFSAPTSTCTSCPTHQYTNANGQSVTVSTTSNAGSTSLQECYVTPDTYFTDSKGTYHYKSDCKYKQYLQPVTSEEECIAIAVAETNWKYSEDTGRNHEWEWDGDRCMFSYPEGPTPSSFAPTTEAECNALAEKNDHGGYIEWEDNQCVCYDEWNWDENGLGCYGAF
ncbi:MAG: hypothetical protein IKB10_03800 [Alphaproteobacteria bacterium]|nr:hypothetical protein [Alphaproteobacteria bacterium]